MESSWIPASPPILDLFVSDVIADFYRLDLDSTAGPTPLISFMLAAAIAFAIIGAFSLFSSIDI